MLRRLLYIFPRGRTLEGGKMRKGEAALIEQASAASAGASESAGAEEDERAESDTRNSADSDEDILWANMWLY